MTTTRRWQGLLLGLCGAVLATVSLAGAGEAASCGDTAGPSRSRVPCACGDTVVTHTRLRATDPVVTTPCTASDEALTIGVDHITLDCRGLTISGNAPTLGLTIESAFRGILSTRTGVTIQNCTVQFVIDGIEVNGSRHRILNNITRGTVGGIVVDGNDNRIEGNRSEEAAAEGITVLGGVRNLVNKNTAIHCFDGFVIVGSRGWVTYNVATENQRTGILVDADDNVLLGNLAKRNGDGEGPQSGEGFLVDGHGNTLIGNYANDNDAKGFCVVPGNTGALNMAAGNGQIPEVDFACELE